MLHPSRSFASPCLLAATSMLAFACSGETGNQATDVMLGDGSASGAGNTDMGTTAQADLGQGMSTTGSTNGDTTGMDPMTGISGMAADTSGTTTTGNTMGTTGAGTMGQGGADNAGSDATTGGTMLGGSGTDDSSTMGGMMSMGGTANADDMGGNMTSMAGAGADLGGAGGADSGSDVPVTVSDRSVEGTCQRWNADTANMDEGTWSGNVQGCDPGDISAAGRDNALRLYNLMRWLADLPAVDTSQERNEMAQACALIMEANGRLSHSPDSSWDCFTDLGLEGASSSNISTGSSVRSVQGYMIDRGNATTIGHRRWILSNSLGPIGIGSTGSGASCMQNLRGEGQAGKEWMAWPPPGVFPMDAYGDNFSTLSDTGWTLQSDSINLSDAALSITSGGMDMPVSVTQLQGGYGSRYAFRFNPEGWDVEAGQTYSVEVTGIDTPIAYDVEIVDCSE